MWICYVVKYPLKEKYSIVLIQGKLSAFFPIESNDITRRKKLSSWIPQFHQVPYSKKMCVCGAPEIKYIVLVLFNSQQYGLARALYLQTLLGRTTHWDCNLKKKPLIFCRAKKKYLHVLNRTAKPIVRAIVRRTHFIEHTEVACDAFS